MTSTPLKKVFTQIPGEVWILTGALAGVLGLGTYASIHKMNSNTEVTFVKDRQTQWKLDEPGKSPKILEYGRDEDPSLRAWKLKNQTQQYH